MTTQLQPVLKPDKVPPANEGHVNSLSADERLLRKAVQRVLKAQVAEVHGRVEGGAKAGAVPAKTDKWDKAVVQEIRPIWFGLFKKGGDRALKEIRRFPRHARKMAVLSWAEMQASERVEVVEKGGAGSGSWNGPGDPRFAHEGGGVARRVRTGLESLSDSDLRATGRPKDELALSMLVKEAVLRQPNGTYLIETTGRASPSLKEAVSNFLGFSVETDLILQTVRGLVSRYPEAIGASLTLGLEEVRLSNQLPSKSLKATPSVVIPDWIEDPDVLDALENEMFKFAHGIDQTTADALRDELMAGMEDGETISQLADRISGLSDEWVEGWRSEMIARTETARAFTTGHIEAWRSTGVVSRKIWVASGDACVFCQEMDGTVVDLDENFFDQGDEQTADWKDQEISMDHDYSDVSGPPLHPNCIVYEDTPITTFAGLKKIKDVKVGDLVLTHRGRFRKVIKTFRHTYTGKAVKIRFGGVAWVTVTEDHPVLMRMKWHSAKDIKVGDTIYVAGSQGFVDTPVLNVDHSQVKSRSVYNLSVAEDESYIAKGMVVHNCRCVLVAELDEEKSVSVKGNENSGNHGHSGRPGEVGGSAPGGAGNEANQNSNPTSLSAKTAVLYSKVVIDSRKIVSVSSAYIKGEDLEEASVRSGATAEHVAAAKELVEAIRSAPTEEILMYRSVRFDSEGKNPNTRMLRNQLLQAVPGDVISLDRVSSFSEDKSMAAFYGERERGWDNVLLKIEGPSKSVATDSLTGMTHRERITQGRFEVVRVRDISKVSLEEKYNDVTIFQKTVVLRQIGVY